MTFKLAMRDGRVCEMVGSYGTSDKRFRITVYDEVLLLPPLVLAILMNVQLTEILNACSKMLSFVWKVDQPACRYACWPVEGW